MMGDPSFAGLPLTVIASPDLSEFRAQPALRSMFVLPDSAIQCVSAPLLSFTPTANQKSSAQRLGSLQVVDLALLHLL